MFDREFNLVTCLKGIICILLGWCYNLLSVKLSFKFQMWRLNGDSLNITSSSPDSLYPEAIDVALHYIIMFFFFQPYNLCCYRENASFTVSELVFHTHNYPLHPGASRPCICGTWTT